MHQVSGCVPVIFFLHDLEITHTNSWQYCIYNSDLIKAWGYKYLNTYFKGIFSAYFV